MCTRKRCRPCSIPSPAIRRTTSRCGVRPVQRTATSAKVCYGDLHARVYVVRSAASSVTKNAESSSTRIVFAVSCDCFPSAPLLLLCWERGSEIGFCKSYQKVEILRFFLRARKLQLPLSYVSTICLFEFVC